jgi:hypothetical protein
LVLALMAPGPIAATAETAKTPSEGDAGFSSADKLIADYLENRKISPAIRNQTMTPQTGFGKRRADYGVKRKKTPPDVNRRPHLSSSG